MIKGFKKNGEILKYDYNALGNLPSYPGVSGAVEPMEDDIPKVFIDGEIPTTKDDVLAEMTYISKTDKFHAYLEIKCQGSSSIAFDKKNFTIKMYSDEARETKLKKAFKDWEFEKNKYVLKANYIDHSHARNIVSARLWNEVVSSRSDYETLPTEFKASPKNGAIDGFPVKVYTNGTYQGIYTWNIGKDDWMWGMDEDNPNHVLLCAETNSENTKNETPCNFRALWSGTNEEHWSVEVGSNSGSLKNGLNNLISCVKDTDDETFKTTIGNYLDLQSAIDYYIHQYLICGLDGLGKNMLLGTYNLHSGGETNQLLKYPYYHKLPFFESDGVIFVDNGDNSITVQGTSTSSTGQSNCSLYPSSDRMQLNKGTYTLSVNASDNYTLYASVANVNGEVLHWLNLDSSKPHRTFTIDEDGYLIMMIGVNSGVTINETVYPMLNVGDSPLQFESYANVSPKWIMGAYDMDSTFGLFWNGNVFVSPSYACPEEYQEPYSLLFERMEKLYATELKERYSELRKTVYSFSNMFTHFERFMDNIGKDLYEEDLIPYPNIPLSDTNNIKQLRDFIRDRLAYCDIEFKNTDESVVIEDNIFDDVQWNYGYIEYTGDIIESSLDKYSEAIDVSSYLGKTLHTNLAGISDCRVGLYNINDEWMWRTDLKTSPIRITSDQTKYIRFSLSRTYMANVDNDLFLCEIGENLFYGENVQDGSYNSETGVYEPNVTEDCYINLNVAEGNTYLCNGLKTVLFLDENGNVLEKITGDLISFKQVVVPNGASNMIAVTADTHVTNKLACVTTDYTVIGYVKVKW